MIYLIIFVSLVILSYTYDYRSQERGKTLWLLVIYIVLVLVAGLRYKLGQDTLTYIRTYESMHALNQLRMEDIRESSFAPGYMVLTSFFRLFGPEFTVFQLFHSIVVNGAVFWFLRKNAKHLFFSLLLYFITIYFLLLFQQMRESLAVSVFLLAWPFFREKKWIWWYLCSLLAFSFHLSAIMMFVLPAIYLPGLKQLFVFGWRTLIICAIVLVAGVIVQKMFFRYVEMLAVTEAMVEKAQAYSKSELSVTLLNINGFVSKLMQSIIYPLIAMYCLFNGNEDTVKGQSRLKSIEMFALMSLYISLFSYSIPITGRYNNYFLLFNVLILSDWAFAPFKIMRKRIRLSFVYWMLVFIPMIGFQIYSVYLTPINKSGTLKGYMVYYPYKSYFDQELDPKTEKAIMYLRRTIR